MTMTLPATAGKENWYYDVEVYPNFFCVTFKSYKTDERKIFIIWADPDKGGDINDYNNLIDFIRNRVVRLIGFNNDSYDNRILAYLFLNRERLVKATAHRIVSELKITSDNVIAVGDKHRKEEIDPKIVQQVRALGRTEFFKSLDLFLLFNTIDRTSLKQIGINLKWHNVMDLPYPIDHIVTRDQIIQIVEYNLNDVLITEYLLLTERAEPFKLRTGITKEFQIDALNLNDTDIAKALISKYYIEATGVNRKALMKGRTFYRSIALRDCISPRIKIQSKESQRLVKALCDTRIDPNIKDEEEKESQFKFIYRSKYVEHKIGLGGIHSINPPEIIEEDDYWMLLDVDVASFYPMIMVNDNLYPAHLGPIFIPIYKSKIVEPRLAAKAAGQKVKADGLKITANGTYGLTNSLYSFMYDPKVTTSVCISGQLYLIMLMEAIEKYTDAMAVYSNTDGLTLKLPRHQYQQVVKICKLWSSYTGFDLEYVQFKKMVIKDVNNFVIFTYDKKTPIKAKGDFLYKKPVNKGYEFPIIAKALVNYYDKGIPIEDTVNACSNIFDFMKAQKVNTKKFYVELDRKDGKAEILQKNNRWVVSHGSKDEGKLFKFNFIENKRQEMQKGYFVTIVNQVPKDRKLLPDEVGVNYSFYINEALKIKNAIQPSRKQTHVKKRYEQAALF